MGMEEKGSVPSRATDRNRSRQPRSFGGNGRGGPTATETGSAALGQELNQTGQELIRRNLNVSPTVEISQGYKFTILVTEDLILPEPYEEKLS